LLHTGPGQPRRISTKDVDCAGEGWWLPDGNRIAYVGSQPGHGLRIYLQELSSASPRPITPEGIQHHLGAGASSPAGRWIATGAPEGALTLYSTETGEPRTIPHTNAQDVPIRWSTDGRTIFAYRLGEIPVHVEQIDTSTGQRVPLRDIRPSDIAGVRSAFAVR